MTDTVLAEAGGASRRHRLDRRQHHGFFPPRHSDEVWPPIGSLTAEVG